LPVLLFYFHSLQNEVCTVSIGIFSLVMVIAIDYHIIEIIYKEGNRIIKLAFPYKLFDTVLYIIIIFLAMIGSDTTSSFYSLFFGNLIRLLLSLYLNYYNQSVEKKHQLYLVINQVLLLGIVVAISTEHTQFILFNTFLLACLIFWKQ
jgi:hypothetical protein